ncbi:hypothetical protein [Prauserella cavernicola]|uniref:Phage gp6-like head-tail connector protein n=1 Tax=Prauserella cavernicola TaxID=2800127 RepID=A0A934QRV3_9PSEU|nr:hypothetical protein [Prauserella cavernicola]MBK1785132.1 hypothetical protein [Prauserella cavernicola]
MTEPAPALSWPPTVAQIKIDQKIEPDDTRDDVRLQQVLDAAIVFVRSRRPRFNYDSEPESTLPAPTHDLILGTMRLAFRWHTRRRSPDALIAMGELGSTRVPSFDPDIEQLLRIGRYAKAVIG